MGTYKISGLTLHTTFVHPPIPMRQFDWQCIDDNYDGAPDAGWQCTGGGETEIEAIYDYLTNYLDNLP